MRTFTQHAHNNTMRGKLDDSITIHNRSKVNLLLIYIYTRNYYIVNGGPSCASIAFDPEKKRRDERALHQVSLNVLKVDIDDCFFPEI